AVIYGSLAGWVARVPRRYAMITGLGYGFLARSLRGRLVSGLQRFLYRLALPRCHTVVFQNPDDRELFQSLRLTRGVATGVVNGSGVDIRYFHQAPQPERDRSGFLMIGRLLLSKGVREYLE